MYFKMKTNIKLVLNGMALILIGLLLISSVSALFAISQDYSSGNPLSVGPGETKEAVFGRLQNPSDKDLKLKLEITEGSEIAQLASPASEVIVPAKSSGEALNIKVSIGENVLEGTNYNIVIKFTDMGNAEDTGTITVSQSSTVSMPVLVKKVTEPVVDKENEQPAVTETESTNNLLWVIGGIIIILLIIIGLYMGFVRGKKTNKKRRY